MTFGQNGRFSEISDLSLAFFVKIVPFAGLFIRYFASACDTESFFSTAISFNFWHVLCCFMLQKNR
jgi:hypothetical protein